jgi:hypothetical protein
MRVIDMKKILLATVFLAAPTIFCMETKAERALADKLKQEVGEIFGKIKKSEHESVSKETISIALKKAFGKSGPEHVEDGCMETIHYCCAEMDPAARTYARGFLDAITPEKEYQRIVYNMLKGVHPKAKL